MIRIFLNSFPYTLSNDLKAFAIDEHSLKSVQIRFTKQEVESFRLGGVWTLFMTKLKHFLPEDNYDIDHELHNYEYIGCLGEVNDYSYTITARFKKFGSAPMVALPLPSKDELMELGLILEGAP